MKILVPVDFSPISNHAALYAAQFAEKFQGQLTLFHGVNFTSPPIGQVSSLVEEKIEDLQTQEAMKEAKELIDWLVAQAPTVTINFETARGSPLEALIEDYAQKTGMDLVVMGTKGASGLKKIFYGSNTVAVINKSTIPVIAVPETAAFKGIKTLLYASDLRNFEQEIQKLIPLAQAFEAKIDVLHILPEKVSEAFYFEMIDKLKKGQAYPKIQFHLARKSLIFESLKEFIKKNPTDLIVIFPRQKNFISVYFDKSLSDEVAYQAFIPLLAFKIS